MSGSTYFARHFGFSERPFTLLPDPDFLYWSPAHKRAFTMLEYGVFTCAPITVITGEVGAGKTTLLQKLLSGLGDEVVVGLVSNAQGGRGDLLHWAMGALGLHVDRETDYVGKFQILQDFIIDRFAEGRRVLLMIDEAQNLSIEGLEELRMLTNINSNKDELLQLILVGQPELREMISRPELRQFAQRVTASFHIPAMDLETTRAYVRHRLTHVGGTGDEFTDGAVDLVYEASDGVPRLINKLCDFSLAYAMSADRHAVDAGIVRDVLADDMFVVTKEPEERPAPVAPEGRPAPVAPEGRPSTAPEGRPSTAPTPLRLDRKFME